VSCCDAAVFNLDLGQLKLVSEALFERRALLENAPHLTATLPILMPCYQWWEVPFYWAGLKAYDLIAGGCGCWCVCCGGGG
jgi:glycerol-3-phosphate dehydrogenase